MVPGECTPCGVGSGPIRLTLTRTRIHNKHTNKQLTISMKISPSSSAQQVAGIEDLLTEIFLRLPPKSLLRFQCVSKQWFTVISSTHFRRLHTRRNSPTAGVFLCRHPNYDFLTLHEHNPVSSGRVYDRFSGLRDNRVVYSVSSCNGLLCLGFKSGSNTEFYVYNLTTGDSRLIPVPDHMLVKSMNLAYDPKKSHDYDIVCVWFPVSGNRLRFSVYGSGNWRHSNEYFNDVELCCYRGVFLKGAVHWFSQTGPFLCFEVESCEFKPIPSTPIQEGKWYRNIEYFGESGGNLHLIEIHKPQDIEFDVLELKSDYSEWFVKYHVNLQFMTNLYPGMVNQEVNPPEDYNFPYAFTVLCFLADEEENKATLLVSIPGKIIAYNIVHGDDSVKEIADVNPDSFRLFINGARYDCFDAYKYVDSLALV